MSISAGIQIVDQFIGVAKELAKLPAMVLPQYQAAATDLYEICKKILTANENMARWLQRFRYFNFQGPNARAEFLAAASEYKALKSGPQFKQLKFSCSDIAQIYYRQIASKIGNWFTSQQKEEEARGIFDQLTNADNAMVEFAQDAILGEIDKFLDQVERFVDVNDLVNSETTRLVFKANTADIAQTLEKFGNSLSELVLEFAGIARVPITLA